MNDALRKALKRLHYALEIMLTCVRWYVAYRKQWDGRPHP
jgi:putative transposase